MKIYRYIHTYVCIYRYIHHTYVCIHRYIDYVCIHHLSVCSLLLLPDAKVLAAASMM